MAKNPYMNTMNYTPQQDLLASLSQEVINIYGINVEYIQNPHDNVDALFGEDRMPTLGASKTLVVYMKDAYEGLQGGAMYTKFGFMNQQQVTLQIAVKEWDEVFGTHRPMEGDIIYFPYFDRFGPADFFKLTFVDKNDAVGYFPLGKHHVFEVTAEKWAYSSENFSNTGVPEIDEQLPSWSMDTDVVPADDNNPWNVNTTVQEISDSFVVFNPDNPFGTP